MAATMATVNVVAVSSSAVASTSSVMKSAPAHISMGSFRGQRLVVGRGAGVAVRRSLVQVRAEDQKNLGEQLSAKIQEAAENLNKSNASSNAKSAARSGQSKLEQGADGAENLGAKIAKQAEDLKSKLFGAQKDAEKNVNKAKSAADSTSKDAQNNAGNALESVQQKLSDAVEHFEDGLKSANREAGATGKDAEKKAGNALGNIQQGLNDAVQNINNNKN